MATLSPIQIGHVFGVWVELPTLLATATTGIGARFQLPIHSFADTSLNRASEIYTSFTLSLAQTSTSAVTLLVYASTSLDPAAFGAGNFPATTGDLVATQAVSAATGTKTLTLDLGLLTANYRRAGWQGVLALSIFTQSGSWVGTAASTTLDAPGVPEETGMLGRKWQGGGRIETDPKTGEWFRRDDGVRDGYTRQLVAPRNWDPRDRRRSSHGRERD